MFKLINNLDGNDETPLESENLEEALVEALAILGYTIVVDDELDEGIDYDEDGEE